MQIIPAIDLLGTDATRLERGDYDRELFRRPALDLVAEAAATGPPWLHLVDLDGARSGEVRLDFLTSCIDAAGDVPVQVSGGIRTVAAAMNVLERGAARVLIGTAAFASPTSLNEFVATLGDRLAVTLDQRNGYVRVAGWLEATSFSLADAAQRCVDAGVTRVLGTAIDRDGTLQGPDLDMYKKLCGFPLRVLAAGGVRDQRDVDALALLGCEGAITGRAFAEGWRVK